MLLGLRHGSLYLHGPCRTYHTNRHGCASFIRGRSAVFFRIVHILITVIKVLNMCRQSVFNGKSVCVPGVRRGQRYLSLVESVQLVVVNYRYLFPLFITVNWERGAGLGNSHHARSSHTISTLLVQTGIPPTPPRLLKTTGYTYQDGPRHLGVCLSRHSRSQPETRNQL